MSQVKSFCMEDPQWQVEDPLAEEFTADRERDKQRITELEAKVKHQDSEILALRQQLQHIQTTLDAVVNK